ncbi:YHS domain-containing protein [Parasalinivibrio latis]|uniref:YHS domain-containing (seleno)protein n=1 Tax=Parasalinivibrio latis TaxID=2952610 RepID=UPI0030DE2B0D
MRAIFLFITLVYSGWVLAADPIYTGFFSDKALGGYDTVAFFTEGKPVKGQKSFQTNYKGATWLFSSQQHLEMFEAEPDKYAPQYGGYCAWAIGAKNDLAPGDPKYWHIVDNKLYLNYNQSVQNDWLKDVPGFIASGDKNWPELVK